jgi:dihydrofolate synthase/folylpolyglutamate synthase
VHYGERICWNGQAVDEDTLVGAFRAVEAARKHIPLTYFEFGTLAAMHLFCQWQVEIILLEVGLGGRLDATNIWSADVSVITSIDHDHESWLGTTRRAIAREKAGVMRYARPVVIGDPQPPLSLYDRVRQLRCQGLFIGVEFSGEVTPQGWDWHRPVARKGLSPRNIRHLPKPTGWLEPQVRNAATALTALVQLEPITTISMKKVRQVLAQWSLPGRLQRVPGAVDQLFDVAHNPAAIRTLGHWGPFAKTLTGWPKLLLAASRDKSALVRAEAVKAAGRVDRSQSKQEDPNACVGPVSFCNIYFGS